MAGKNTSVSGVIDILVTTKVFILASIPKMFLNEKRTSQ